VLGVRRSILHLAAPERARLPVVPPAGARLLCVPLDLLRGGAAEDAAWAVGVSPVCARGGFVAAAALDAADAPVALARRLLGPVHDLVADHRRARVLPLPDGMVDLCLLWDVAIVLVAPAGRMPAGDDPVFRPADAPPLVPDGAVRTVAAHASIPGIEVVLEGW